MGTVQRFEDLQAWQEARKLALRVYDISNQGSWVRDFGLRDQIRRAAVSVMSNIAEGFGRDTDKELHHFLSMAKGSAAEVASQLYIASDLGYLNQDEFAGTYELVDKTSRLIGGLMRYLRSNPVK